jgi:radical SAM protein with 4Fe4S-binding SPASM domain
MSQPASKKGDCTMSYGGSVSADIFLSMLGNRLIRSMMFFSNKRCRRCGKSYLEIALDRYLGEEVRYHSLEEIFLSNAIKTAIDLGLRTFEIDQDRAKEALRTPYFKNGLLNVLEGISRYGVSKPFRTMAPFLVVWNYTNACNLKCVHCYQRADKPTPDELTTEERLHVVDQLVEDKVSALAFSGGEPLMRRDLFKVAEYAHEKGLYLSVATNGTLLTRDAVESLRRSGVSYVEISLDGACKETHDSFRGVEGSFDRTLKGIENAVDAGLFTCIAITATKKDLHEIPMIYQLAKKMKVKRVIVFNFIPTGRGEEIVKYDLSPREREDLMIYLYSQLAKGHIEALCTAPQYSRVCLQESSKAGRDLLSPTHFAALDFHGKAKQLSDFLGGCGAGRLYCAIQPNGLITPCVFMPIVVGDLRKQSLKDIWLNSEVMDSLRDRDNLKGRCGHCTYKYICGGCRARAYAYYGDYLAPDPGCIRELEEPSTAYSSKKEMSYAILPQATA